MSLQIWLPLTKNIGNQGLGDHTFTNTNASYTTDNKFGNVYSFNGSSSYLSAKTSLSVTNEFSISFWVKFVSLSSTACIICCRNDTGNGISLFTLNGKFRFDTATSTQHWQTTFAPTTNTWYHVVFTKDANYKRMYINGVLTESLADTASVSNLGTHTSFGASQSNGAGWGNFLNGYLHDIRVYDHCLSPKEIKELSKGLFCHYPMNEIDGNIGGRNILKNGNNIALTGSDQSSNSTRTLGKITVISDSSGNAYTWVQSYLTIPALTLNSVNQTVTYSVDIKTTGLTKDATTGFNFRNVDDHSNSITATATIPGNNNGVWMRVSATLNITASTTRGRSLWIVNFPAGCNGVVIEYKNPKLEIGNNPNPVYTPAPEDGAGSDTIIYDVSGLGNNATITSTSIPSWSSNAKIGQGSYEFSGSQYIILPQSVKIKDEISINVWAYMDDWSLFSTDAMRLLSCTEGGGWNFEPASGAMQFAMGTGTSSNTYKTAATTTTLANFSSGWHMITGTYDGLSTKIYLDGKLEKTNSAYTTKTPIYYHATNGVFIGAESAGTATTPGGNYFKGLLSDCRIYATALSASDIEDMYEIRHSIANNGMYFCNSFVEHEDNDVNFSTTGVGNANSFQESPSLYDMKIKVLDDGSFWARIFWHDCNGGSTLFTSEAEVLDTHSTYKYSKLKYIESFRSTEDNKFEFMLCYPTDNSLYNRWKQSDNPTTVKETGTSGTTKAGGYEAIHIDMSTNYWGGLLKSSTTSTFIDGSVNHSNWFYAIGSYSTHGDGIPSNSSTGNDVELWARIDRAGVLDNSNMMKIYKNSIVANQFIEY